MGEFILTNLLMVSLVAILVVAVSAMPRVGETHSQRKQTFWERLIVSEIPEKVDVVVRAFTIKFLRKSKVLLMKLENSVTRALHGLHADEKPKIDLGQISSSQEEQKDEKNSGTGPTDLL